MNKDGDGRGDSVLRRLAFVRQYVRIEHLAAGVLGGVSATLVLHPLDLVKIRFAVNDGLLETRPKYHGLVDAFRTIWRADGVPGLYRGVTPNVIGAGAAWGLYFLFYNTIKSFMQGEERKPLGPGRHMFAAAQSGVLTLALTNPLWVVKTRLCLQYESPPLVSGGGHSTSSAPHLQAQGGSYYKGMWDALAKVYRYEGVPGLYKGFVPGLLGVSHGALQFMAYEELKKFYVTYKGYDPDVKFSTVEYLGCAALSKLFAALITYPYQVVRARLQDQHTHYTGLVDCVTKTFRMEGVSGFYKGLTPYMCHVMPSICIVFLIYEQFVPRDAPLQQQSGTQQSGPQQSGTQQRRVSAAGQPSYIRPLTTATDMED